MHHVDKALIEQELALATIALVVGQCVCELYTNTASRNLLDCSRCMYNAG
jgi:hypothetical protein